MDRSISASVGTGGVNQTIDTVTIQQLLNSVPLTSGGPSPFLEVDGLCGPITKSAIQKFQLKHFGWSKADGRVDPDGPTLAKLNEFDKVTTPQPSPAPAARPKSNRFMIVRMGTERVLSGLDRQLFFYMVDVTHNLGAVYWLQAAARRKTSTKPPGEKQFGGAGGARSISVPRAIDALHCLASWVSTERMSDHSVSSTLLLGFPESPVQIPMNHHLIGREGIVSAASPGASGGTMTALTGQLIFIEYR